jgi:TldD protein
VIPLLAGLQALAVPTPASPDALTDTLTAAVVRHREALSLGEDAPPIHHLRYHLVSLDQVDIHASLGHALRVDEDPSRTLAVELRVGTPAFDNTGFGGWENGFGRRGLPDVLTPHALDLAAWRLTDQAYKEAVEQYARKQAQWTPPPDHPGDYTEHPPVTVDTPPRPASEAAPLRELAEALSARFVGVPGVERGDAFVGHEAGLHVVVDSGGHRVDRPVEETSLRVVLHLRADDGMLLTDSRLWSVRQPSDLPPREALIAEVDRMRDALVELSRAPVLDEEVVGPVVFHDRAAVDLFRELLLPQLEGTPPEVPFETFLGDLGRGGDGQVRMGRRVLPLGWEVVDDPERDLTHPGAFTHDYEGTPAQRVALVEDGIVRSLLMSRVPRKDLTETNGHARGGLNGRLSGRPMATSITPPRHRTRKRLHKRALRLARAYGRDWYLRVDRLQVPAVRALAGDGGVFGGDEDGLSLPRPVALTRVWADGRTERLRGGRFSGVQRFVLRDIAEAGPPVQGTFMLPHSPGGRNWTPITGLPTWIAAPEVLVGELELLPTPPDSKDRPRLPHPFASADEADETALGTR